jgi:hypothetical protein
MAGSGEGKRSQGAQESSDGHPVRREPIVCLEFPH